MTETIFVAGWKIAGGLAYEGVFIHPETLLMLHAHSARWLLAPLAASSLFLAVGCDDNKKVEAEDGGDQAQSAEQKSEEAPKPAAEAKTAPAATGITVQIKDFQLFHPSSSKRTLRSVRDDGTTTRSKTGYYGVGVVVEATNDTGKLLRGAWFEGEVRFVAGDQTVRCQLEPDAIGNGYYETKTTFLSLHPNAKVKPGQTKPTLWRSEADSLDEATWRPGETIRMIGRDDYCAAGDLADMGVSAIEGELTVKSLPRYASRGDRELRDKDYDLQLRGDTVVVKNRASGRVVALPAHRGLRVKESDPYVVEMSAPSELAKDGQPTALTYVRVSQSINTWGEAGLVESSPVPLKLPPRALTMQLVKLPDGKIVHASGNRAVYLDDKGKIQHTDLSELGVDMLAMTADALPGEAPKVTFTADELSGSVTNLAVSPHVTATDLAKGERQLEVTWELNLAGGSIDARLRAKVDEAKAAVEKAYAAVDAASEADVPLAKAALARAQAGVAAAEAKYNADKSRERGRLAGLLACGDIKLVTNQTVRTPSNKKDASTACSALKTDDKVTVKVTYTLDRYELPAALSFGLGRGTAEYSPIASATLAALDPR